MPKPCSDCGGAPELNRGLEMVICSVCSNWCSIQFIPEADRTEKRCMAVWNSYIDGIYEEAKLKREGADNA